MALASRWRRLAIENGSTRCASFLAPPRPVLVRLWRLGLRGQFTIASGVTARSRWELYGRPERQRHCLGMVARPLLHNSAGKKPRLPTMMPRVVILPPYLTVISLLEAIMPQGIGFVQWLMRLRWPGPRPAP